MSFKKYGKSDAVVMVSRYGRRCQGFVRSSRTIQVVAPKLEIKVFKFLFTYAVGKLNRPVVKEW